MAELAWHIEAIQDLDEIAGFIARQSPDFAPLFVDRIVRAAERLVEQPRMGRAVPELGDEDLRELIFQNYRIVYWVRREDVMVLGVLHSAIDFVRVATNRSWFLT